MPTGSWGKTVRQALRDRRGILGIRVGPLVRRGLKVRKVRRVLRVRRVRRESKE